MSLNGPSYSIIGEGQEIKPDIYHIYLREVDALLCESDKKGSLPRSLHYVSKVAH